MKIIIHPWARKLRNGKENPKNYPHWKKLVAKLQKEGHEVIQVGEKGEKKLVSEFHQNLKLNDLKDLIKSCDTWISVDSFFQHLGWSMGKKGIVLFGQSNPRIFGHSENINLYTGERYFKKNQFNTWEEVEYIEDAFVSVDRVLSALDIFK